MFQTWLKDEYLHCVLTLEASVQFKCLWYLHNAVGFKCKFVKIFVDRRIVSKYSIKIRSKVNQDWNSFKIMNRTAPWQTQVYGISVWMHIEILNNFLCQGVPLYTRYTQIFLCIGNYNTTVWGNFPVRLLICSETITFSWIKVCI